MTASTFAVYGIVPQLGRPFSTAEADHGDAVALLGHEAWLSQFGRDSSIIGRTIAVDGRPVTIIGVMPRGFRGRRLTEPVLWIPMTTGRAGAPPLTAVVRLRDGVTRMQAEAALVPLLPSRMESNTHTDSIPARPSLVPVTDLILGSARQPLFVMLGAVGLVLVIVISNISTMLLARTAARADELRMRRALGASTGRQLRQLLAESMVLTGAGSAIGLAIALWLTPTICAMGADVLPRTETIGMDWRVALFFLAATSLVGVASGLPAALTAGRSPGLRLEAARGSARAPRASAILVAAQIAFSLTLLVGAGLLVKGFLRIIPRDPGFAAENRATVSVRLQGRPPFNTGGAEAGRRFLQSVLMRVRAIDGVRNVTASSYLPFIRMAALVEVAIPDQPQAARPIKAFRNTVDWNFFAVMEMQILQGRAFTAADRTGSEKVAIVNQAAARRWWPGQNAIGRRLAYSEAGSTYNTTVVGVVRDARRNGTDTRIRQELFVPATQGSIQSINFIAHVNGNPRDYERALRHAVWMVTPELPIETVTDLESIMSESIAPPRFFAAVLSAFGLSAAALTAFGLYGLLSFGVATRRREIGIRLALGASPRRVGGEIVRSSVMLATVGVGVGIATARALTRAMEAMLLEVSGTDASVFLWTAAALLGVSVVAACIPAWRAARIDPIRSLRV
jgi:predicted permease